MTVGDLREIINDPDVPDDAPLRILTRIRGKYSSWEWDLVGAFGTLAGEDKNLTLDLEAWTADQVGGARDAAVGAERVFLGKPTTAHA